MIILQGQQLSRLFGTDILFENINLHVQHQSRIALVGRNGTGKSTLLKILAGIEASDSGSVSVAKDISIGYLDQHSAVDTSCTIWEEMLSVFSKTIALHQKVEETAALLTDETILNNAERYAQTLKTYDALQQQLEQENGYRYEADIRSVLHGFRFYEADYHRSIATLSGGQKTRLALAKLLLERHDLLILDEPTNHLDIDTLGWLETYLANYKGALLIVSHDRYFLDKVANEVYEISQKSIQHYKGNYSYYLTEKATRLESAWKAYEKQQVEINKLEDFVAKNLVRASTTKRAQSRRKQLEKMVRLEKPKTDNKAMRFQFVADKESGQVVLQGEQLAIGYEQTTLSAPITLDIRKQEAIALIGPNGIGKSTLLKSILGQLPFVSGEIKLGANVTIGYYDQEQQLLSPQKSVLSELWDSYPLVNEKDIRSVLGSFLFSGNDVLKPVHALSGGERARLLLAKLAMKKDNFLILDEPTNHLDLESKEVLENALIDFNGTLLFISHDRYFINRIATSIVELSEHGSQLYIGDYDYYVEKKQEQTEQRDKQTASTVKTTQADYVAQKETQKIRRQLERAIQQLEDDMSTFDQTIADRQTELAQPDVYSDFEKSHQLTQEIEQIKAQYDLALEKWEQYHLELEALQ